MKQLFYILLLFISFANSQITIGSLIQPASGCELGCVRPRFILGKPSTQNFATGAYYVEYYVDNGGGPILVESKYDVPNFSVGITSLNLQMDNCFNFTAEGTYDVEIVVHFDPGTGMQTVSKTFTIVSNAQVFPGNISGPSGFCSDGLQASGGLNILGSSGSVYNWYFRSVSTGGNWTLIGDLGTSYAYGPLSESTQYKVVVENGFCPPDSTFHTITMSDPPSSAFLEEDVFVCKGDNEGCLRINGGDAQNYIWYENLGAGWVQATYIPNQDTFCYNDIGITKQFRVAMVNPGCQPVLTNQIIVDIDDLTDVGTVTATPSPVCVDNHLVTIDAAGSVTDAYQWQVSLDGIVWTDVGIDAANFTENALSADSYYRLIVKNGVCPADTSASVFVQVDQTAQAPSLIGDANYCQGANSGTVDQVGLSVGNQLVFEQSTNNGASWSSVPFTGTFAYTNLAQSTLYRLIYENGVCPNDTSNVVSVILDPMTVPGVLENDSLICTGNLGELNLLNSLGDVVKWQTKTINAGTWTDINVTDTFYNFSGLTDTTLYRVIVQSGVCPDDTSNIVTLDYVLGPDAGALSSGGNFCIDNVNHGMTLSGYNGTIVDWEISYDGTTFAGLGNPVDTYTASGLTQTVWYRVAVELNNCPYGYSDTVEVNVSPLSDPGTLLQDATYCEGDAMSFVNLISYTDTLLKFEFSDNGGVLWLDALPDVGEDTLTYNITNTTTYRALVQSGVCPPVYSNEVTITVNPLPELSAGEDFEVYEGESFQLNGFTDAINFFWSPAADLDDANALAPNGFIENTQYFYFFGESGNGCSKLDSVLVTVLPPDPIFDTITNAITVNGDGYNDYWIITGIEKYPSANVQLIDKWGREVFQQVGYNNDFDANELPAGAYMYLISFEEFERVYKGVLHVFKE